MSNPSVQTPEGTVLQGLDRPRRLVLSFFAVQQYERIFKEDPNAALDRIFVLVQAAKDGRDPQIRISLDAVWGLLYCALLREDPTLTQAALDKIVTRAMVADKTTSIVDLAKAVYDEAARMGYVRTLTSNQDPAAQAEPAAGADPNSPAEAAADQEETASASGSQKRSSRRSA